MATYSYADCLQKSYRVNWKIGDVIDGRRFDPTRRWPLEARVTVVDRVADAASSTFGVRLEIANPGHRVPGGLKCKVRIGNGGR